MIVLVPNHIRALLDLGWSVEQIACHYRITPEQVEQALDKGIEID